MSLSYKVSLIVLFILFLAGSGVYLHRVPGLMGDEASEGENVYLLLHADRLVITGERSYIGPLLDYLRVPFILLFGYSALSLRLLVWLFSLATFWLTMTVCRRLWGDAVGLVGATAMLFSPIYLLFGRLGWAITIFPLVVFLVLYFLTLPDSSRLKKHAPLLAGLTAGLGLHNHILILPTLAAVAAGWLVIMLIKKEFKELVSFWPALVGLAAGFGTQLAVMLLDNAEYVDAVKATGLYGNRLRDLPGLLPMVISGSSYVARYTGIEFAPPVFMFITWGLAGFVILALLLPKRRGTSWIWLLGLGVQLLVLLYLIFQFSLRYFVMPALGVWLLAGVGLGAIFVRLFKKRWQWWPGVVSVGLAVLLLVWTGVTTLIPFLGEGGSTGEFSIGNRNDSAAALVDTRQLLECLRGAGPVYAESVHIYNRLQYLSHNPNNGLDVVGENESKQRAKWVISYRLKGKEYQDLKFEKCPSLKHWRVVARDKG
ncbi:MAG: glycosyltransferase family 39 protein [bacterium]